MKKFLTNIFNVLCKPSTKPDITSYKWARREYSILASYILWLVWFLRVLSLYQYVKLIYRILGEKFKFGYTENQSGRPDVPPWLGEIYFISFTVFFSFIHAFDISNLIVKIITIYYLYESCLWIIYYTVFRRFFEIGYTIFHRLEYITMMVLIIPTQALCFARLYNKSFREMLSALFGAADFTTPLPVVIFGYFLTAIVISIIISTFPTENVKECKKKAKTYIIGCGDVVLKRLYPAVKKSGSAVMIEVHDLVSAKNKSNICTYSNSEEDIKKQIDSSLDKNSVVWIETPPDKHFLYLKYYLSSKAKLTVVEKPLTVDMRELAETEKLISTPLYRKKVFFLSYYILEKALPLTYISCLNKDKKRAEIYEKYLYVEERELLKNSKELLGKLKSAKVHIFEEEDTREWLSSAESGGHLFETFIHNVLIADLFCAPVKDWKNIDFFDNGDVKNQEISLCAESNEATISLKMQKNSGKKSRTAEFVFERGYIKADFDTKSAEVYFELIDKNCSVSVRPEYSDNYLAQVDMVYSVLSNETTPELTDGLTHQPEVLRWLHDLSKRRF